jgi:hypothetical protein
VAEVRCAACLQALALFTPPAGPVYCFRCHPANLKLQEERQKRIEAQRKKAEAEVRKIDKQKSAEAGEGFRQKES